MAGKKVRQVADTTLFKWKSDFGTVKPDLGIALGLKYIRDALKEAKLPYTAYWDDDGKGFVIVGTQRKSATFPPQVLATAIVFGDLETLQNGSPEAMVDLFESRVINAVNSLEVQLLKTG